MTEYVKFASSSLVIVFWVAVSALFLYLLIGAVGVVRGDVRYTTVLSSYKVGELDLIEFVPIFSDEKVCLLVAQSGHIQCFDSMPIDGVRSRI